VAKRRKTGGRKKGTPNKLTVSVQEFIEAILTQEDAVKKAKAFLNSKTQRNAIAVFMRLLEYRFGRPRETIEHTGASGGPIAYAIDFVNGKRPDEPDER